MKLRYQIVITEMPHVLKMAYLSHFPMVHNYSHSTSNPMQVMNLLDFRS